ncbi:flagellar filament capping protein FliD [Blastococcus saxobsidens]|uniref:Flagellar hook-associated protein 2 n=1 Tax=Blastococcus saxobsidens (strain DD2) TaxID=1146883 RepID=H6RTE4_BLASD|nr:flagellar filament capping protein FliD [Blastococcus saxobsidens]CCG01802.1 Flagellar capping protein [Blastococcus saxobsidens DD2]
MTMSMSMGLVSGMDTGSLVTQLLAVEAAPQRALKDRLSLAENTAGAYRKLNSSLQSLSASAQTLLKPETWTSAKGTSSAGSVAITAGATASPGSLTFTVASVAATHSTVSTPRWTSTTTAANITDIEVKSLDGTTSKGIITLDGTESLDQVAAKINARSDLGLVASVVQTSANEFALQINAATSGKDAAFSLAGTTTFKATTVGQNAELKVGTTADAYSVTSASNVFEGVLSGSTITVSTVETTPVTVSVVADPEAVTGKVSAFIDAVNATLKEIKSSADNAPGSRAVLRGEYAVTAISGRLLDAVARAVGANGSPAQIGIELTREGTVTFDEEKFTSALKDNPSLARALLAGTPAGKDANGGDVAAVPGIAERLRTVADIASDTTTGTLTSLAKGQDSMARDIQDRIADWDIRLANRKLALTRQFTAMETALSSLQNQSNWLAGQLGSLPSA